MNLTLKSPLKNTLKKQLSAKLNNHMKYPQREKTAKLSIIAARLTNF